MITEPVSAGQSRQNGRDYQPVIAADGLVAADIAAYVIKTPGLNAAQIAADQGMDTSAVGPLLRAGRSNGVLYKDKQGRWWPMSKKTAAASEAAAVTSVDPQRERIDAAMAALKSQAGVLPQLVDADRRIYSAQRVAEWLEDIGADELLVSDIRELARFVESMHSQEAVDER